LALLSVVFAGCHSASTPPTLQPSTLTMGAAAMSSDAGTIHSGSIWMKEGSVAVAFAPPQPCHDGLEFSWVALIKNDCATGKSTQTISPIAGSWGDGAHAGIKVEINGKGFELLDQFKIDMAAKKITEETLEVNGKPRELQAGRVFLVDLTAQLPTVEQIAVDLSGPAAGDGSIEGAARQARAKVTKSNEAARRFVGATE
jgi:hypothetical protein